MFSYYGSKSKIVKYYPKPTTGYIIEPFAGTARYSLMYWENEVTLIDKYERLIDIWLWLQSATIKDIEQLPILKKGENLNDFTMLSKQEKDLLGFMIQAGVNAPRLTCTEAGVRNQKTAKKNILRDLHKIKHWQICCGDYNEINNHNATWFVDPPYQNGGQYYRCSNKSIDFEKLGNWCKSRNGELIVCENTKADWMDFKPLKRIQGMAQTNTTEAVYLNGFEKDEARGQINLWDNAQQ